MMDNERYNSEENTENFQNDSSTDYDKEAPKAEEPAAEEQEQTGSTPAGGAVVHDIPPVYKTERPYEQNAQTPPQDGQRPIYDAFPSAAQRMGDQSGTQTGTPYGAYGQAERNRTHRKKGHRTGWLIALCAALCFVFGTAGIFVGVSLNRSAAPAEKDPGTVGTQSNTDTNKDDDVKLPSGSSLTEADPNNEKILSVKGVYTQNADAVVEIVTETEVNYFYTQGTSQGAGSGVILTEDGYIVTNYHVIEDADAVHVRLRNGDYYEATIIGSDAENDIAVLKIDTTGLTVALLGDSSTIEVGDLCIAIGNPLGTLGGTVTDGIISALDREITIDGETMTLLQHNAAVNPGNSGGGLFNEKGELIGIVNAKSSGSGIEGIGFAIPINSVKSIINDLVTDGYVHGKFKLGLNLINIIDKRSATYYNVSEYGIYISEVTANSNAELAGLAIGDRIISVNGEEITTFDQISAFLESSSVGDVLNFKVMRDGKEVDVPVTLYEYIPDDIAA